MKLGHAIAKRRVEVGLTQLELAKKVGVSKSAICRWESGDISNMGRDKIQKLSDALKVSPLEFLVDETDGFKDNPFDMYATYIKQLTEKNAPDDEIRSEIIEMVKGLSDSQALLLRDFLKGMISE